MTPRAKPIAPSLLWHAKCLLETVNRKQGNDTSRNDMQMAFPHPAALDWRKCSAQMSEQEGRGREREGERSREAGNPGLGQPGRADRIRLQLVGSLRFSFGFEASAADAAVWDRRIAALRLRRGTDEVHESRSQSALHQAAYSLAGSMQGTEREAQG
jgi:hypothetical protein